LSDRTAHWREAPEPQADGLPLPSRQGLAWGFLATSLFALSVPVGAAASALWLVFFALDAKRGARPLPALRFALPTRVSLEEDLDLHLELDTFDARDATVRLALNVDPGLMRRAEREGPSADDVREVALPSGARAELTWPLRSRRRGLHRLRALHLRMPSRLGLAWHQRRWDLGAEVEVIPGLRAAQAQVLRAGHQHRAAGRRRDRRRGDNGAFESLREYVRGDDPRRIDWKGSAKRSSLMVRQYELERAQQIVLVLDCGRTMAERIGQAERLDRALESAVVLSQVARVWQDQVGVLAFADHVQLWRPPDRNTWRELPSQLATVEARPMEPDYPAALTRLTATLRRRSLIVFFSDVHDSAVSAPLAAHLAPLAKRHLPLFVALRNPALSEAARTPLPDNARRADRRRWAFERAAAWELEQARATTLETMRRQGVRVLDVHPDQAIEGVVQSYLELKAKGAL
jgi:uncharacterized protein (DUF58 family)